MDDIAESDVNLHIDARRAQAPEKSHSDSLILGVIGDALGPELSNGIEK
jgi:hypothetical protein